MYFVLAPSTQVRGADLAPTRCRCSSGSYGQLPDRPRGDVLCTSYPYQTWNNTRTGQVSVRLRGKELVRISLPATPDPRLTLILYVPGCRHESTDMPNDKDDGPKFKRDRRVVSTQLAGGLAWRLGIRLPHTKLCQTSRRAVTGRPLATPFENQVPQCRIMVGTGQIKRDSKPCKAVNAEKRLGPVKLSRVGSKAPPLRARTEARAIFPSQRISECVAPPRVSPLVSTWTWAPFNLYTQFQPKCQTSIRRSNMKDYFGGRS